MQHILQVISALNEANAKSVVVGGVAVVLQGHPRLTVDLDLMIALDTDNVLRTVHALEALGLVARLPVPAAQFADAATRERWHRERGLMVFSFHDPADALREVDLFAFEPIPFTKVWESSQLMTVDGVNVRVADIPTLIEMKQLAGRPQDLADIAALRAIMSDGDGE